MLEVEERREMRARAKERQEVVQRLVDHRHELEQLGVRELTLFGSFARDQAGPRSDVDLLVDLASPATFDAYADLCVFLERVLGRRVDVVRRASVRADAISLLEQDALPIPGLSLISG